MSPKPSLNRKRNKDFVVSNQYYLKQYAQKNYPLFGWGVIVINLLHLKTDVIDEQDLDFNSQEAQLEQTIHQPISYITQNNFWFKMLSLKIKKKYQIDIQSNESNPSKCLVIFIKDASIEHFSIYSLKL